MKDRDKQTYIAEEAFVILHSGEIPEVTLHEALYHLTEDPDGPGLALDEEDILPLKMAVLQRYRAIILRDLAPANRDKSIYRGLARTAANWQRLLNFCTRENLDFTAIQAETAAALINFLTGEVADVKSGQRFSCINCSSAEIEILADSLKLSITELPRGWRELCLVN